MATYFKHRARTSLLNVLYVTDQAKIRPVKVATVRIEFVEGPWSKQPSSSLAGPHSPSAASRRTPKGGTKTNRGRDPAAAAHIMYVRRADPTDLKVGQWTHVRPGRSGRPAGGTGRARGGHHFWQICILAV